MTTTNRLPVVLSGSYRRAPEVLRAEYDHLIAVGCRVLSPSCVAPERERDGFLFMRGESSSAPERIEDAHLTAIRVARFVWLHAPGGYVGLSAALEIGYAAAVGTPVFSREEPSDPALRPFVRVVSGPESIGSGRG
jgi:hypothetical protein